MPNKKWGKRSKVSIADFIKAVKLAGLYELVRATPTKDIEAKKQRMEEIKKEIDELIEEEK